MSAKPLLTGIIATLAVVSVGCAGSGSGERNVESATSTAASGMDSATTQAPLSDEQQIRALYAEMAAVFDSWDGQRVADLTCAKLREKALHVFDDAVPPLTAFGSPEELKATGVDQITTNLLPKLSPASEAEIRAVASALVANDNDAYTAAMLQVMKKGSSVRVDKVENIAINGDTATADSTTTRTVFTEPPQTETTHDQLVREDGRWKDCTPPDNE
ncbi:hypothetical protein AFM11_34245 [Mycolicibacterium wolinskyi]|uniref:Lipoprotein n=1 Tax=Mycolicibacterium wolinskyi TaxID=59750 RepID=A0A132PBL5_9MYCO|nr:hypothetical protein [Mycolicibacterium wolinskyi]KWX19708.1 hypothetical protein AFM11_34245 [Mycolicibacterium wolinskyi]